MDAETSAHARDLTDELIHHRAEVEQLRAALGSRAVIDQAKGILMARYCISAERAFGLLSRVSQERNQKVRLLSQALIDSVTGEDKAEPVHDVDVGIFDVNRAKDSCGSIA